MYYVLGYSIFCGNEEVCGRLSRLNSHLENGGYLEVTGRTQVDLLKSGYHLLKQVFVST